MQKYNDDSYAYVMLSEHARAVAHQPDIKPGWQTREAWRTLAAATDQLVAAYRVVAKTYGQLFKQIGDSLLVWSRHQSSSMPVLPAPKIPAPRALGVLRTAKSTWTGPRSGL